MDAETYRQQRDRDREQVGLAELKLAEAVVEHLDVDSVLAYAEYVLTDSARLWEHAAPEHRRRLQQALFPEGLVWEPSGKFRTTATASLFKELREIAGSRGRLASPTGFEPVSPP